MFEAERNYAVVFEVDGDRFSVVVSTVRFETASTKLVGADPSVFPKPVGRPDADDGCIWVSEGPTLIVPHDSPVDVKGLKPTEEEVEEPEVYY